jgi:LL-H family phage holin
MNQALTIYVIGQLIPALFYVSTFALHYAYRHLPSSAQSVVKELAGIVVPALEQNASLLNGAAKKQEATRIIQSILASIKIQASPELIDACIEAAVYSLKQSVMTAQTTKLPIQK